MSNPAPGSTRAKVLQGSIYLIIRRGIGIVLSFAGLLLLTRIVGPGAYGLFTSAYGLVSYLQLIVQMGLGVYLIRSPQNTPRDYFHQAFCWLLVSSLGMTLLGVLVFSVIGHFWVRQEGFIPVVAALMLLLPVMVLPTVPMALLERELDYQRTTFVELSSQFAYYIVGIAMAWAGWGVWSLVGGFAISQLTLLLGFYGITRYRPAWCWNRAILRDMLSYSFTHALSSWLYNLRSVAPSMILLPFAGKEAVGYFSLAMRFLSVLNFASEALGRITIPAFARIQHDLPKLRNVVTEGMYLRLLATGMFYVGFIAIAGWVLPFILGKRWDIEKLLWMFPILAVPFLIKAITGILASALHVIRRSSAVAWASLFYILIYFASAWILVRAFEEPYNLYGFGFAEWLAMIHFLVLHRAFKQAVGTPRYTLAMLWLIGYTFALFAPIVSWWLALAMVPFFLNPISIRTFRTLIQQIRVIKRAVPPGLADKESGSTETL